VDAKRGHRKLLEQLAADGIDTIFGNPGSSEEGLLDEIGHFPGMRYVLGLQEAAVVLLAAGYAQAGRRPAVVQLHSSVGTGNALGSLYHTMRMQRTPLVVIAGEAGMAYDPLDAHMSLDLVAFARPVTKYAARATHPGSLLRLLRRCVKTAMTPPYGPTFLAVPQDVLDQVNDEDVVPSVIPNRCVAPAQESIAEAASLLAGSENPVIIVGDGISQAHAQPELAAVAEQLGASVWGAMVSEPAMPWSHPLYAGLTGHMFGANSRRAVETADAVLICGTYVFPDVFPLLENPFRPDARIVQIDLDTDALAKNHPVTVALASDPKPTLALLADALDGQLTPEQKRAAAGRAEQLAAVKTAARQRELAADADLRETIPLHMPAFAEELAKQLPADALIYDEALTYSGDLTRYLVPDRAGSFFQTPGGTLGVAFPGAVGANLAHPDRTVIGFGGDGGALYTFLALWTAAHYRIATKFVVCNNRSYRLLKDNLVVYREQTNTQQADFPASFDIRDPDIDYVAMASGLGVRGMRVTKPAEISEAVTAMLAHDGPFLIDLILEDAVDR
jgi:thiamine pyrophosphate-dependent acetolactate synthase large subunit-like protein